MTRTLILGGGMSGLAAGLVSGYPVCESLDSPGGISTSYQLDGYHFCKGGAHYLFGNHAPTLAFIKALCTVKRYERRSSVFFPDKELFVPYPLQVNLDCFDEQTAFLAAQDYATAGVNFTKPVTTMKDALLHQFGDTLCDLFFWPFNENYTAGLLSSVAPQDAYKNPSGGTGYNSTFVYPAEGLGTLARRMAARCDMRFGKRSQWIDVEKKTVHFADDTCEPYENLISTLPLNRIMEMTGLSEQMSATGTFSSVLVLNIGALRGKNCPDDHWVYVPSSKSGYHRVGFYSNVDRMFLPPGRTDRVSIYVEKSSVGEGQPSARKVEAYSRDVVDELREWGWIKELDVCDANFVDVAYTYRNVGSTWREDSLALLEKNDIQSIGRFGAWHFQGIMESIKEGFEAGVKYG